ncbi:peptidoglycan-binding protein [Jiella sp. M17.18]|uniref:peptidoglycan-binding protein n=1 Tax=Jiella sp. M17.18 TaxID=3234247 RepID=UPI0034DFABE7
MRQKALNGQTAAPIAGMAEMAEGEVRMAAAGGSRRPAAQPVRRRPAPPVREVSPEDSFDESRTRVPDITRQLERLREELRADMAKSFQPRFDDMRAAFDALRKMIDERASSERIDAEIARVDDGLSRMADSGADQAAVGTLREELQSMRDLVEQMAREESLQAVGRKWDALETRISGDRAEEAQAKRDIKDELERLRSSLGTLASEEQIKAVERRWEEFEARYLSAPAKADGENISELLKTEMNGLREKLETLASEQSVRAVEARWGSLDERFASRELEEKIEAMAARMAGLETALAKLPETLTIAPLEERIHSLAVGIEAVAKRQQEEADLDHFVLLEERLDEISRAIVAATHRSATVDMSPVERIEARLQTLSTRVDELGRDGDTEAMSARIAELADRIEAMANSPAAQALGERLEGFAAQLDLLAGSGEAPSAEVQAIEARLQALTTRLEETMGPRVDEDLVRTLEAQINRLSQQISENGAPVAVADPELDQRLTAIERRLDENRDAILASARAAADEAVRQMLETGDTRHGEHVAQLSQDLRSLEALSREKGAESQEFFETVHKTLLQLVDRIGRIESDLNDARSQKAPHALHAVHAADPVPPLPQAFAASESDEGAEDGTARGLRGMLARKLSKKSKAGAGTEPGSANRWEEPPLERQEHGAESGFGRVETPALDASDVLETREANRPLAIGSGAPDITSLLERVRAQQAGRGPHGQEAGKADFIAAARRAAMAAAAEAESLRSAPEASADDGSSNPVDIASRRRKPILMAIGAVILALAAIPAAQTVNHLLASRDVPVEAADARDPSAAADIAAPAVVAPPRTVGSAAGDQTSAPAGNTAGAVQPDDAAASPAARPAGVAVPQNTASQAAPAQATSAPPARADAPAAQAQPASSAVAVPAAASEPTAESVRQAGEAAQMSGQTADVPAANAGETPSIPDGLASPALAEAAQKGDPKAQFEIGLRLMEGRNGSPDAKAAARWFTLAAGHAFAPAEYSLGTLYEKGNGVDRNLDKARDEYLAAADQGNVRAMHNLAVLYATGIDGKSDPKKAADWFQQAASYGMTDSQYNLGILYARGAGVDQDMTKSYKWFSIVAESGDKDAANKRDEVKKSLSPAQVKAVDTEVANFQPKPRNEAANTVDIPKAWEAAPVKPSTTSSVDVTRAIRNIQTILTKLGYDPGTPDGIVGTKTTEAIKHFQKDTGLTPNGDIDEALIRALLKHKDS